MLNHTFSVRKEYLMKSAKDENLTRVFDITHFHMGLVQLPPATGTAVSEPYFCQHAHANDLTFGH